MSPEAVVFGCIGVAALAMAVAVVLEVLEERAQRRRERKRPGYVEIPPGHRRLP